MATAALQDRPGQPVTRREQLQLAAAAAVAAVAPGGLAAPAAARADDFVTTPSGLKYLEIK